MHAYTHPYMHTYIRAYVRMYLDIIPYLSTGRFLLIRLPKIVVSPSTFKPNMLCWTFVMLQRIRLCYIARLSCFMLLDIALLGIVMFWIAWCYGCITLCYILFTTLHQVVLNYITIHFTNITRFYTVCHYSKHFTSNVCDRKRL